MNIQKVIQTIIDALESNLDEVLLMLIAVTGLYLINIFFGTIQGTKKEGFDIKKFFFGFEKMLMADVGIFGFCYILNLLSLILMATNDIIIKDGIITTLEIIMTLWAWAVDTSKDILAKIQAMKTLKYISYDDVQINPDNPKELG